MNIAKRQITNDDICVLQTSPRACLFAVYYHKANGLLLPSYSRAYQEVPGQPLDLTS